MAKAKCKNCGKPILWVVNKATGRPGPVDVRPTVVYRLAEQQGANQMAEQVDNVHISHWITCPKRAEAARDRDANKKKGAATDGKDAR